MQSKARLVLKRRAVLARISRTLAKEGHALRSTHGDQRGDWIEVDKTKAITMWVKDLEAYGRKLDVIAEYEQIEK